MDNEVSLDAVMLSKEVVAAWHEIAISFAVVLKLARGVGDKEVTIPYERARVNDNGTLTIFLSIPGVTEITMNVPVGRWSYRQ